MIVLGRLMHHYTWSQSCKANRHRGKSINRNRGIETSFTWHVHECLYASVSTQVLQHTHGGQRTTWCIGPCLSPHCSWYARPDRASPESLLDAVVLELDMHTTAAGLHGIWGSKIRSSCLHSKYFIQWTTSPARAFASNTPHEVLAGRGII